MDPGTQLEQELEQDLLAQLSRHLLVDGSDGALDLDDSRGSYLVDARTGELTHAYDALFMVDEVRTGVGMTGTPWAYQQLDLTPDVVAFGRKTQVCGIMARGRGLCCAVDLPDTATRDAVVTRLFTHAHALVLGCGTRSIRFRPTLTAPGTDRTPSTTDRSSP